MIAQLFSQLGQVVLVYDAAAGLRVEGGWPAWFPDLWPVAAANGFFEPGRDSLFLENFLVDAVGFWETMVPGRLESGSWSERAADGSEYALSAVAVRVESQAVLVVEAFHNSGLSRRRWGQSAREMGLLQERLENTEAALRLAKAAMAASQQTKISFLTHMSHEIRTPLNGVLGSLELIQLSTHDVEQRGLLETAQTSAEDLLSVVSDLLDHSKIEAGRLELRREDFRLRAELDLVLRPLLVRAQRRHLRLTRHVAADIPDSVHGDIGRLSQVLLNLVGNSLKFTSQGSIHVDIDAPRLPGPGHPDFELRIKVTDTGIGIEPRKLEYLFHPAALEDNGIQRRYGGTKLGLAVCQRLVTSLGGRIQAVSEPGKGSELTFTVRLELAHNPGNNPPPLSPPMDQPAHTVSLTPILAAAPSAVAPPERPLRVLVADDHPVNRQLAAAFLEKLGHPPPTFAVNGREALNCMMRDDFDLVLMDLQMPELDGVATTAELRRREDAAGAPRLPVIAFTAHVRPDDQVACLAAGMDGFLTKPLRYAALAETLERVTKSLANAPLSAPTPLESSVSETALAPALLDLLRTSTRSGLADLVAALACGDTAAAGRAAHFLKGGLALLYDGELNGMADELETAAAAGDWASTQTLTKRLSQRIELLL